MAAVALAGCSSDDEGAASDPSVDVSSLDVGRYATEPRAIPVHVGPDDAKFLEAARMLEALVDPQSIASDLDEYGFAAVTAPQAVSLQLVGDESLVALLEQSGLIAEVDAEATDQPPQAGEQPALDATTLVVRVVRVRSAEAAKSVAAEYSSIYQTEDFGYGAGPGIAGRPDASSSAVVDENGAALTAALPYGDFAVFVYAQQPDKSLDRLAEWAAQALDEQVALLDDFSATPLGDIADLPADPDGLLARTFATSDVPAPSVDFANYGPRAAIVALADNDAGPYEAAGVDRATRINLTADVIRTRDAAAATTLASTLIGADEFLIDSTETGNGVPGTRCFEQTSDLPDDLRFTCYLTHGRYVAEVWSPSLDDVLQRAAAQFALLADN